MLDSNGRLQSGLLSGSLFNSIGNYEQCLKVSRTAKQQQNLIQGTSYCLAQIELLKEARQLSLITDQQEAYYQSGRVAKLGLCVPATCQTDDIESLANHILSKSLSSTLTVKQVDCYRDNTFSWSDISPSFTLSLFLIVFLVSACTSATILGSIRIRKEGRFSKLVDWLVSTFSLSIGWNRLTKDRGSNALSAPSRLLVDRLRALDGLRVISMLWMIAIHSYNFGFQWLQFDNAHQVDNVYKTIWVQWIANGTFSVDNFFLISGLLVTSKYLLRRFGEQSKVKRKLSDHNLIEKRTRGAEMTHQENYNLKMELYHALSSSIKRYFRLAPVMMTLILLSVGLLPLLARGPNWHQSTTMFDLWCRTGWHLNLFMVQNMISTPTMCFSHSWYVAADWQLFVLIQLIFLVSHWFGSKSSGDQNWFIRLPKVILELLSSLKWLLILLIIIAQLMIATTIYQYGLVSIPLIPSKTMEAMLNYYSLIYIKPHYWLASYFIGCLTAICLLAIFIPELRIEHKKQEGYNGTKIVFKRWLSTVLIQFASLTLMAALILSALPYFRASQHRMSSLEAALYGLISRPLWSLCIGTTLILAALHSNPNKAKAAPGMTTTRATPTNQKSNPVTNFVHFILSGYLWLPFGRLSYSAYLLHPVLMATFYGSRTETFQFSHWLLLYFVVGNIVLTYAVALVIHLFIETPIQVTIKRIERHYLLRDKQLITAGPTVGSV